jgi:hypothetical protein
MRLAAAAVLAVAVLSGAGCQDLRSYHGLYRGNLVRDETLRQGFGGADFGQDPAMTLDIGAVDRLALHGTLTVPGLFDAAPLDSIARASGDALGEAKVGHDPLRSYFAFVTASSGGAALAVVSLLTDDRVEVRIIRGNDELYGLFLLERR